MRGLGLQRVFGVVLGMGVGLLLAALTGESPLHVAQILWKSAFGSAYDFGMTLFFSAPLVLTGLSVWVAFRAGLFNIGAEGQLTLATLAVAAFGALYGSALPPWLVILGSVAAALGVGALWGGLAGWLRASRGAHEVIVTIMLNFVAAAITHWLTLSWLRNPASQYPETLPIPPQFVVPPLAFFQGAPLSGVHAVALVAAVFVAVWAARTRTGFNFLAVGQNAKASRFSGISPEKIRFQALALAGALAGLVGIIEVFGNSGRLKLDFSPGFGFSGIAVAVLAGRNALGVIPAALLLGALQKGASDLDLETETMTREMAEVFQALVILCVSFQWQWPKQWRKQWTFKRS